MELAELKSECVFTVQEGSHPLLFLPQTIFLCALCPVRIIPYKSHIALKKNKKNKNPDAQALENKTGALYTPEGRNSG